ncbi:phage portal protein [Pseudonocardia asaccharolytica]|uniref:Portal protein n=1 Tax=Pseudonocardia asaccharolytica DSM 44247 = NBRC 16224 TaxID=1123024 RepID=A0A511CYQ1_9PSEU|nr:phage portal protein [Pseudonocardia asaccharolytica]GEL17682.1 hypothetical protein PA7_15190 [Pseudonocardia asaccharolytica DSM 44247 = NBRC 16224]
MGLGALFHRNLVYEATDTKTGQTATYTVVTDGGPGMYADWAQDSYRGGMSIPGAWRAARLQAGILGGVPWHAYQDRGGRAQRVRPSPALVEQPAPPDVRVTTFSSWHLDLLWHGNALGLIVDRGRDRAPTAVVPVPARSVFVRRIGQSDNQAADFPVGEIVYWIGGRWRSTRDVIHVKGLCEPGALRGMGILEAHLAGALGLSVELDKQARGVSEHAVPSVKIKSENPDLTQVEADELKAKWMASVRTRVPVVLNPSTDVEPIAWNPTETQLLEARKFSLHEIALIFGLDPSWLGAAQASRVYANIEQEGINLVRFSLQEHFERFEQTLSAHLPAGMWVKAALDGLLRADTLGRYKAHAIGIREGFLQPNEARALEDWAPIPGLDEQWAEHVFRAPTAGPPPAGSVEEGQP